MAAIRPKLRTSGKMAKNWAITIGINTYSFLPSLHYAKQDAEAVQTLLQHQAEFERVFFFSDDSPAVNGKSTQPSRANLLRVLRQVFEAPFMGAGDNFWFFFSGHGIRHDDRDYLLPTDGDPEDIENTAISINYITERLRRCGADNVVLVLDACRKQDTRQGQGIGRQAAEIARQTGVISIFSCSPNEYSYEVEDLQHGVFTQALLEGLGPQGQCGTVSCLDQYLATRVPQLSQHYGKPRQTPYTIAEPISKHHLILFPQNATPADIAALKNEAYRAIQIDNNLELAEQLWIRVLEASSGRDMEAIRALQRVAQLQMESIAPEAAPTLPDSNMAVAVLAQPALHSDPTQTELVFAAAPAPLPTAQLGHRDAIVALAISPSGKLLASGSRDQTVRLWDLPTETLLQTCVGHSNLVNVVVFTPDERLLVSGGGDNTIQLWDCSTGKSIATLTGHSGWVLALAITPDGKTLVSSSADGSIKLWDLQTYQEYATLNGHLGWVSALAISPDGQLLVSGSHDRTLRLWNLETGECLHSLSGHADRILCVSISANGRQLVSLSRETLKRWHLPRRKLLQTLPMGDDRTLSLAVSPNQRLLVYSRAHQIELSRLGQKSVLQRFSGHRDPVTALVVSPDSKTLVSGGQEGSLQIWRISDLRLKQRLWVAGSLLLLGITATQVYGQLANYCLPQSPADCLAEQTWVKTLKEGWLRLSIPLPPPEKSSDKSSDKSSNRNYDKNR